MKAVLRKYAQQINSRIKLPPFTSYLFEFLSSLQIIYLIFANMEDYLIDDQFLLSAAYKCIGFFTKIVFVDESSSFKGTLLPIWCFCICYLSLHIVIIILLLFAALLNKQPSHRILKVIAIMVILQGRILFFPIQFFFMMVCRIYRNHDKFSVNDGDTYFGINWVFASAIFAIINSALAFAKEHTFYQITNITGDVYASKGNQYHRITNLYKNVILLVLFSTQNEKTYIPLNAIFHILFNLILIYVIFKKLPFYHLQTLKISIIMISTAFSLSLLSFLQAVVTSQKVLHGIGFFILFFPVLSSKFGLSRARTVFVKILQGDNSLSPEYTIHSVILVSELIENEHFLCPKDHNFYPSKHKIFGALHQEGIDLGKLIKTANIEQRQSQVYRQLVKKVERCLGANPKSAILIVFMTRMYLRLQDAGRVGELIRRLETLTSTIQIESAIENFWPEVEKIFKKEHLQVESQAELSNYFKYKVLTNQLKVSIVKETNKHLEFWNDIEDRKLDVKKSIDLAGSIDDIFQKIQKIYEKDSEEFRTNFQLPLLIYAVYLNNIRYLPHEGSRMLKKFERSYHYMIKSEFNIYSTTSAVVVVSLDPKKAGQIIDYSGSILNVFNMTKSDLQGLSFGCFFPSQIAKTYQSRIHQYAKSPSYKLDSKYKTFGKTKDGNFFEVEAHFKLHSYLDREMTVVILFTKLSNPQPLFIVNYDGAITDFSQKLGENFRSQEPDLINFRNIQDVSSEFLNVNQAFNLVYANDDYQYDPTPTSKDQRTTLRTLIIEKDEDFRTGPRHTLDSHPDFPLLSSMSRDEDALLLTPKRGSRFNLPLSAASKPKSILRDKMTGSSRRNNFKKMKSELSMEKARNICEKYTSGRRIFLHPLLLSKTNKQVTVKFSGDVQIRPYILDGEVHKVIIINNLAKDKGSHHDQATDVNTATFKETSISSAHDLQTSFNDDIPKNGSPNKRGSVYVTFQEKPDLPHGKTISIDLESISNPEMINSHNDGENSLRRPAEKTPKHAEEEDMRSRTSSIDHTYMEIKVIKTLKEVFANKSLQFSVRVTLILIVLLVIVILGVVTANFLFSRKSTTEIQIGVRIVNFATQRLLYIQKAWQWALFIYVGALGVLPFPTEFIQLLGFYLMDNVNLLAKQNNNLKDTLADLDAESLLTSAFKKDINMYEPLGTNYLYVDHLDTFTATDILVNKYTEFNIFDNVHELAYRTEVPFMFNNTANDYMVKSNELISETEVFLQDIISRNIKTLNLVLGLEIFFLVVLAFILFAIIKKILAQHRKLFKSIVKIHRENVIDRISTLKQAKQLFEQDFEVPSFIQNNYDEFVRFEGDRAVINNIKASTFAKYQDFHMKAMKEYMFKVLAVSLIFIPLLIGLFIGSLTGSISAFEAFDYANNQISVLCMASYQGNMPLSSFGYAVIFGAYPSMLIYNQAPMLQIQSNFNEFGKLNNKLTNIFLKQKEVDPILKNMLQGPMCKYLEPEAQSNCEVATKGNSIGLLGVNPLKTEYINSDISTIFSTMFQNQTQNNKISLGESQDEAIWS